VLLGFPLNQQIGQQEANITQKGCTAQKLFRNIREPQVTSLIGIPHGINKNKNMTNVTNMTCTGNRKQFYRNAPLPQCTHIFNNNFQLASKKFNNKLLKNII
jgi:hypothetical protein